MKKLIFSILSLLVLTLYAYTQTSPKQTLFRTSPIDSIIAYETSFEAQMEIKISCDELMEVDMSDRINLTPFKDRVRKDLANLIIKEQTGKMDARARLFIYYHNAKVDSMCLSAPTQKMSIAVINGKDYLVDTYNDLYRLLDSLERIRYIEQMGDSK